MRKKILLTYAMYGNGHRAIAQYIESYLKDKDPELDILSIDILKYSTPVIGKFSQKITDFFLLKFPVGWSIIYELFDTNISSSIAEKTTINLFKNKRMKKVISDFNPDLTISTHFFGSSLINYYNKKGIIDSKLITVITDYESHSLWLKGVKNEEAIIVADKDEVSYLVNKGVEKRKIKAIGIPINPVTSDSFDRIKMIKKYGFSGSRPICVFFGGGGNGGTHSLPFIKRVIRNDLDIDFIYIAGKNQKSKNIVDKWIKQYNAKNIKTLGFVKNVPELLQICDFVVSKPGGAQSTECLYFKKPIIMINCSGGQEIGNYKYFVKNGYGKRFRTVFMFIKYMRDISRDNSILDKMKKNMSSNKNNKAMEKLYDIVIRVLNSK